MRPPADCGVLGLRSAGTARHAIGASSQPPRGLLPTGAWTLIAPALAAAHSCITSGGARAAVSRLHQILAKNWSNTGQRRLALTIEGARAADGASVMVHVAAGVVKGKSSAGNFARGVFTHAGFACDQV